MAKITYKNIRHGYARIDKDWQLQITIPSKLKNNEWFKNILLEKGEKLLARYQKKTHILTSDNNFVLLFGEQIAINDIYKEEGDRETEWRQGDKQSPSLQKNLQVSKKIPKSPKKSPSLLKEILQEYVTPILDHYSEKLGIKYRNLTIRKTSSKRWSCTHDQNISLNLSLVHLPTKFIKYVIIHECCHLKIKNHSKKFRALVESFCPEYKNIRNEMRKMVLK